MKFGLVLLTAVATVGMAASPAYKDRISPAAVLPRAQGRRKHSKHKHHVPDFRTPCDCPPANCPEALIKDPKSLCACKASHAQACYFKSNGGCPPARVNVSAHLSTYLPEAKAWDGVAADTIEHQSC